MPGGAPGISRARAGSQPVYHVNVTSKGYSRWPRASGEARGALKKMCNSVSPFAPSSTFRVIEAKAVVRNVQRECDRFVYVIFNATKIGTHLTLFSCCCCCCAWSLREFVVVVAIRTKRGSRFQSSSQLSLVRRSLLQRRSSSVR